MSLIASNLRLKPDAEYHLNDVCFEMSKGEIIASGDFQQLQERSAPFREMALIDGE